MAIRALRLGEPLVNVLEIYTVLAEVPELTWVTKEIGELTPEDCEDLQMTILFEIPTESDLAAMDKIAPYTVFYMGNMGKDMEADPNLALFLRRKKAQRLVADRLDSFLKKVPQKFWSGQVGRRMPVENAYVSDQFQGTYTILGHDYVQLKGYFGRKFRGVLTWKNGIRLIWGEPMEIWPEFTHEGNVRVMLELRYYTNGENGKLLRTVTIPEEKIKEPIQLLARTEDEYVSVCLRAKGTGVINARTIHVRKSRLGAGHFLVGGKQYSDKDRHEFFSYFHPMDMRPPLNVYFAGYRPEEGFEGYHMMEKLGAPFLLFYDPRLEGGDYYTGSEDYEQNIVRVIRDTMDELGFDHRQLIMSGISMGSYAALYYGAEFSPFAILAGKPVANISKVAHNEKLIRPGVYPASLDSLLERRELGQTDTEIDEKLWKKFEGADLHDTLFALAYMQQDDYDPTAYEDVIRHLRDQRAIIYGKGILGRHNDNSKAVMKWFTGQFDRILQDDFGRNQGL